jgi:pilus assembly protein CpaC
MNMWTRIGRSLACTLAFAVGLAAPPALAADAAAAAAPAKATQPAKKPAAKKAVKPRPVRPKAVRPRATVPTAPVVVDAGTGAPLTAITEVNATLGKSALINLARPVARMSIGNPAVADVILTNSRQLYVLGKAVGSTNLMLWDRQGNAAAVIDLNVSREFGALSSEIQKLVPGSSIRVRSMGASIVLEGHVPDALTASKASDLAEAFIGKKPVNLLSVDGAQQVMLEVKVAEVSRTLVDALGARFSLSHPGTAGGGIGWTILGDLLSGNPSSISLSKIAGTTRSLTLDMEKDDGLVKILAEPNIVALSGQEGGFLAGGEIFIPVPQGNGTITMESHTFGVGLKFTPTVLEAGRIHMRVAPEVTDVVGFTNVASTALGGSVIVPTLSTRRASTTVELRDGQTLAIGGLLNDKAKEQINRLPLLGEIPILGALFRSSEYQTDRTELVILVTPRLIKPLSGRPPLPTDAFKAPNRGEFFLEGRMEGRREEPPAPAAAPAPAATPPEDGHQLK